VYDGLFTDVSIQLTSGIQKVNPAKIGNRKDHPFDQSWQPKIARKQGPPHRYLLQKASLYDKPSTKVRTRYRTARPSRLPDSPASHVHSFNGLKMSLASPYAHRKGHDSAEDASI
jgi:hypothetical protein